MYNHLFVPNYNEAQLQIFYKIYNLTSKGYLNYMKIYNLFRRTYF